MVFAEEKILTIREELDLFIERADEFANSKYILADVKIVNLLKAIASSGTLLALFKNCLTDFDYESAKKRYLVKSQYQGSNKGEFVMPPNSRELIAFVFNVLMEIDANTINLSEFINKYFFVDGSFSSGYEAFITSMIKPFANSVKLLMESVIEGKLQDPVEALVEEETRRERQREIDEDNQRKQQELSQKKYGASIKAIKDLLLKDKQKIKAKDMDVVVKDEMILVIDMLANVVESQDKDAIEYAFVAYKYLARVHKIIFFGRIKKIGAYINDIINGI